MRILQIVPRQFFPINKKKHYKKWGCMQKTYCVHVSVLLDNPKAIQVLRNGEENKVILTTNTFDTLDKLQKNARVSHIVKEIVQELNDYPHFYEVYWTNKAEYGAITDVCKLDSEVIAVVNDALLSAYLKNRGLRVEAFKDALPYQAESQFYTGFLEEGDAFVPNSFFWREGKMFRSLGVDEENVKMVDYENELWKIRPRNPTQNAAMELLLAPEVDVVSVQSLPGMGKTHLALAAGLHWVFEKKRYHKLIIVKHNLEVGEAPLGFLPGIVEAKVAPFYKPIMDLLMKLHETRPCNKLFVDVKAPNVEFDPKIVQFTPIQFLRGQNIEDAFVIVDEAQNLTRQEVRVVLSRMGQNVKCVLTGDVQQIDALYLNEFNNGLNWVTKQFKGFNNYGHIVLKSKTSRGPIADLVRNSGL